MARPRQSVAADLNSHALFAAMTRYRLTIIERDALLRALRRAEHHLAVTRLNWPAGVPEAEQDCEALRGMLNDGGGDWANHDRERGSQHMRHGVLFIGVLAGVINAGLLFATFRVASRPSVAWHSALVGRGAFHGGSLGLRPWVDFDEEQ
jgi:hypothetical protein